MYKFTYPAELWDERAIDKTRIRKLIEKHSGIQAVKYRNYEYYLGRHEILNRQREDSGPNNRVVCNHAKDISDTATGYFMGSPITYANTGDADIEKLLIAFDRAAVDDVDADNALDASVYGLAYEYVYAKKDLPEPTSKNISPVNTFIVYDDSIEENELCGVYYYVRKNDMDDRQYYAATVGTAHYIYEFMLDVAPAEPQVPEISDFDTANVKEHYFGEVPFIEYLNNKEAIGDFELQIPLIDAYNTLMSDRVNDKEQFVDAILALYGSVLGDDEEETAEALESLKQKKLIELPLDAKAEYITRQMDENGVEVLRKALKEDIYTFSHVPNLTDESFAGNVSGVSLEYKLLGLEMLTKVKERNYRQGIQKRIRLYCNFLNMKAIALDAGSIVPSFSRALPKNLQELAGIVSTLEDRVSERTLLKLLPFVEDPDAEIEEVTKQKEESAKRQRDMFAVGTNDVPEELEEGPEDAEIDEGGEEDEEKDK